MDCFHLQWQERQWNAYLRWERPGWQWRLGVLRTWDIQVLGSPPRVVVASFEHFWNTRPNRAVEHAPNRAEWMMALPRMTFKRAFDQRQCRKSLHLFVFVYCSHRPQNIIIITTLLSSSIFDIIITILHAVVVANAVTLKVVAPSPPSLLLRLLGVTHDDQLNDCWLL
jgi:hypothetical protein